jgi:hypothetical protein
VQAQNRKVRTAWLILASVRLVSYCSTRRRVPSTRFSSVQSTSSQSSFTRCLFQDNHINRSILIRICEIVLGFALGRPRSSCRPHSCVRSRELPSTCGFKQLSPALVIESGGCHACCKLKFATRRCFSPANKWAHDQRWSSCRYPGPQFSGACASGSRHLPFSSILGTVRTRAL